MNAAALIIWVSAAGGASAPRRQADRIHRRLSGAAAAWLPVSVIFARARTTTRGPGNGPVWHGAMT
jgi:hypothetical protein